MDNVLVSVIVPVYNVAEYLDKCIASIVSQTYGHLEVILVDDGATDESGTKCDAWKKKDPRIKVYHKENGGLSDARNYGMKYAEGEIICFVDGDDYIKSDLLEKTVSRMDDQTDMVVFGYMITYPDHANNISFGERTIQLPDQAANVHFLLNDFFNFGVGWSSWSRIYKRDIIENNRLQFVDNKRIFAEDHLFSLSYLCHTKKLVCIDEPLYYYVQREDSIMSNAKKQRNPVFYHCTEECKTFFEHIDTMEDGTGYIHCQPLFMYLMLEQRLKKHLRGTGFDLAEVRQCIVKQVSDGANLEYLMNSIASLIDRKKELLSGFKLLRRMEILECSKWLIGQKNHFKFICVLMKMRDKIKGNNV